MRHLWLIGILFLIASCGDSETPSKTECEAGSAGESCVTCEAGFYCAGGDAAAESCADGTWDDDADASTVCVAWSACDADMNAVAGSATQDQTCETCAAGEFKDGSACRAWTICEAGEFVANAGTTTSDRSCSACATGTFSDAVNATTCVAWTTCEAGEFIAASGSVTADQTCEACAAGTFSEMPDSAQCVALGECAAGTVQTAEGTATAPPVCEACVSGTYCAGGTAFALSCDGQTWDHDANPANECVAWTDCVAGFTVHTEGDAITDRTCMTCGTGTYSTTPNATCADWKTCISGEFVETAGSTTTDRSCATCATETYSNTDNAAACMDWTVCTTGQYITAAGSDSANRTCSACASGTFSAATNQGSCTSWATCLAGEYVTAAGTLLSDRACVTCPADTYSSSPNSAQCVPVGQCAAGTIQSAAATTTAPAICDACVVGTYCPGDVAPSEDCALGTWDHDANPASPCEAWTACVPGESIDTDGSTTTDRICEVCASGTFSTSANAVLCSAWTTCVAGEFVDAPGAATSDQTCSACAPNTYSASADAVSCSAWTTCVAGEFVASSGTDTADQTCSACAINTYSTSTDAASCSAWTTCIAGEFVASSGTDTADQTCSACAIDTYSVSADAASCSAWTTCAPGEFVSTLGTSSADRICSACAANTYSDSANAGFCPGWTTCVAGEYIAASGTIIMDQTCSACAADTFSATDNLAFCSPWTTCVAGEYIASAGALDADQTCSPCLANTYSTTDDMMACVPMTTCVAGNYVSTAGSTTNDQTCMGCAANTYTATDNLTACIPWTSCAAGTKTSGGSTIEDNACDACFVGTYCAGGLANAVYCGGGVDFDDDADPSTECLATTDCVNNEYVTVGPTPFSDRQCVPCAAIDTSTGPNDIVCVLDACVPVLGVRCNEFEEAYVKASNTRESSSFGRAVAISGDTMVVGAPYEDNRRGGINGVETGFASFSNSGSVYVFVRNGTIWTKQAYLKTPWFPKNDEHFGISVAISGDIVVVGADDPTNGVGIYNSIPLSLSNNTPNSGAVHVFKRTGTNWSRGPYIKASNAAAYDNFGRYVALSGNTLIVGAPGEDSSATGINGDQTNNLTANSGAAYVFTVSGSTWTQQAYIKASTTGANDSFGSAVAISGNTLAVGATGEDSDATGVGGDESNDLMFNSGAVFVYARTGTVWSQEAYIKASTTDANDGFGSALSVFGDTLAVGAPGEDSDATGINGDETSNAGLESGAAYIFARTGVVWSQEAYIKASNTEASDAFGSSLALDADTLAVGAGGEASNATGMEGDQTNNDMASSGAVYLLQRIGTTWSHAAYLKASNTDAGDSFGESLAISGSTLVVGASREASASMLINGDQTDNTALFAGAVYVRRIAP